MKKTMITLVAVLALVFVLGVALVACAPKDLDAAEKKMKDAGYVVLGYSGDIYEDCDGAFMAMKSNESLYALHFKSSKAAKAAYKDMQDEDDKDENLKCQGKWVFYGSEGGVKAFAK